jgi:hypothetical protein
VLAGRSRVGARSEDEVQRALEQLEGEGWRLRRSLPWRGRGDIDSVAIAPNGFAFAIETKPRTFDARHVTGVREMALWLHRRRRRWCRRGAIPVQYVVRARGLERTEHGVLIVSLDRLVPALRVAGGLSKRPAFLAGAGTLQPGRGGRAVQWRSRGPVPWASSLARRAANSATRCSMRRIDSISSSMPSVISASSPVISTPCLPIV